MAQPLPYPQPAGYERAAVTTTAERNRVLRNTYWLLALSLLPVVAGAWLGMRLHKAEKMALAAA